MNEMSVTWNKYIELKRVTSNPRGLNVATELRLERYRRVREQRLLSLPREEGYEPVN